MSARDSLRFDGRVASFDGRVAIVTGAGRGLGRAYAMALAECGARVVVDDPGCEVDGSGSDAGVVAAVADEIVRAGARPSPTRATPRPPRRRRRSSRRRRRASAASTSSSPTPASRDTGRSSSHA